MRPYTLLVLIVVLTACSEIELIQVERLMGSDLTQKFERRKGFMSPIEGYKTTCYPEEPNGFTTACLFIKRQIYTGENTLHARAVSSGKVMRVREIPTMGITIIVNHGMYRAVYTNVDNALVAEGDLVSTGSYIGEGNAVEGETNELGFQLYRGVEDLNPNDWTIHLD